MLIKKHLKKEQKFLAHSNSFKKEEEKKDTTSFKKVSFSALKRLPFFEPSLKVILKENITKTIKMEFFSI